MACLVNLHSGPEFDIAQAEVEGAHNGRAQAGYRKWNEGQCDKDEKRPCRRDGERRRMVLRTTNALRAKSVKLRNVAVLVGANVRDLPWTSSRRFFPIWTSAQWRL
jgi:hypothetical protein